MNDDLPCPFCGCEDIEYVIKFTGNFKHGRPVYIVFCKCGLCGASSRSFPYTDGILLEYEQAMFHAFEAWDRRADVQKRNMVSEWILERDGHYSFAFCPVCEMNFDANHHDYQFYNYCPNCGTKMN